MKNAADWRHNHFLFWVSEHDKIPWFPPDLKQFLKFPEFSRTGKLETHFPGFPGLLGTLENFLSI